MCSRTWPHARTHSDIVGRDRCGGCFSFFFFSLARLAPGLLHGAIASAVAGSCFVILFPAWHFMNIGRHGGYHARNIRRGGKTMATWGGAGRELAARPPVLMRMVRWVRAATPVPGPDISRGATDMGMPGGPLAWDVPKAG